MNPDNYGSLPACKKLAEVLAKKGIVLKTDAVWCSSDGEKWGLAYPEFLVSSPMTIPAYSMAEVWGELSDCYGSVHGLLRKTLMVVEGLAVPGYMLDGQFKMSAQPHTNPTDALIELWIWVLQEASHD